MIGRLIVALLGLMVCGLTGCGLLTTEQVDAVHTLLLDKVNEAWQDKGAQAVAEKLAELVQHGKITQAQADALNAAAAQGYAALETKVREIMENGLAKTAD